MAEVNESVNFRCYPYGTARQADRLNRYNEILMERKNNYRAVSPRRGFQYLTEVDQRQKELSNQFSQKLNHFKNDHEALMDYIKKKNKIKRKREKRSGMMNSYDVRKAAHIYNEL